MNLFNISILQILLIHKNKKINNQLCHNWSRSTRNTMIGYMGFESKPGAHCMSEINMRNCKRLCMSIWLICNIKFFRKRYVMIALKHKRFMTSSGQPNNSRHKRSIKSKVFDKMYSIALHSLTCKTFDIVHVALAFAQYLSGVILHNLTSKHVSRQRKT